MERFHWKMKILEVGILVTKLFYLLREEMRKE